MDSNFPDDIAAGVKELMEKLPIEEAVKLTPAQMADRLGVPPEYRDKFLTGLIAVRSAWKEVNQGLPCESCGGTMKFTGEKITLAEDGQGFDVFLFGCSCGNEMKRKWRAPDLDGYDFPAYSTHYKFE